MLALCLEGSIVHSSTPHFLRVVRAIAKVSGASVPIVAATALTAYAGCYDGQTEGIVLEPPDGGCSDGSTSANCYDGDAG